MPEQSVYHQKETDSDQQTLYLKIKGDTMTDETIKCRPFFCLTAQSMRSFLTIANSSSLFSMMFLPSLLVFTQCLGIRFALFAVACIVNQQAAEI